MPNIRTPVIRTLPRFTESFVFYPIELVPDIRTLYWKTVMYTPVYFTPVIRTYIASPRVFLARHPQYILCRL